jgi:hypothetical protein
VSPTPESEPARPAEPAAEPREETRIVIRPDGEVVIENLSELLAEVALELDPEVDLTCAPEDAPAQE